MRHRKAGKKLGRNKDQRRMLMRHMAADLIMKEKMQTTEAKAKFVRPLVEKVICLTKEKNLTIMHRLHGLINDPKAEQKLLKTIGPKYKERKGGYTRIIKLARRLGDRAEVVLFELV